MEKTEIMQFSTKNLVYAIKRKKAWATLCCQEKIYGDLVNFGQFFFFLKLAYYLFICTDLTFFLSRIFSKVFVITAR